MSRGVRPFRRVVAASIVGFVVGMGPPSTALPTDAGCGLPTADLAAAWTATRSADDLLLCHHGTVVGDVGYGVGVVGTAFDFHGGYVEVPDHDLWTLGSHPFVLDLWANWREVPPSTVFHPCCILVGADEDAQGFNKWFFGLGGGVLSFHINGPAIGPRFLVQAPFEPVVGQWYHLATVKVGDTYTIYVNGLPVGSEDDASMLPDPDAPLTIGQAEDLGFFPGLLDEVQVIRLP